MENTGRWFRFKVICASVASLISLSYIDYLTGYQFLFFVFYFAPVALCGWYMSRFTVVCMAILSGLAWCFVDILSSHHYPFEVFRYFNSFMCFVAFATIGLLVQGLRQSLGEQCRVRRQLEQALAELTRTTQESVKLQRQLHVVCAWTKRINVEGKWIPLDEFLTDKLSAKFSYGVSPEAMQEVLQSAESVPELAAPWSAPQPPDVGAVEPEPAGSRTSVIQGGVESACFS
jgi:K+-sensing histidine kinase KdpD